MTDKPKKPCPVDMELQADDLRCLPKKIKEYEDRTHVAPTHLVVGPPYYVGVGAVHGLGVIHAGLTEPILTNDPDYWMSNEGTKR